MLCVRCCACHAVRAVLFVPCCPRQLSTYAGPQHKEKPCEKLQQELLMKKCMTCYSLQWGQKYVITDKSKLRGSSADLVLFVLQLELHQGQHAGLQSGSCVQSQSLRDFHWLLQVQQSQLWCACLVQVFLADTVGPGMPASSCRLGSSS